MFENNRSLLINILKISLPVTLQNIIINASGFIDGIMVSTISESAIGAVNIASKLGLIFSMTMFGICSGLAIRVTICNQKKDEFGLNRNISLNLFFNLLIGFIWSIILMFFSNDFISMFLSEGAKNIEILRLGNIYMKTVALYGILHGISYTYAFGLRLIKKPVSFLFIIIVSQVVNIFLNYFLINGVYFFPKLGIAGAAIATVVAKTLEVCLALLLIYNNHTILTLNLNNINKLSFEFVIKSFLSIIPTTLVELFSCIGDTLIYMIICNISYFATNAIGVINPVCGLIDSLITGMNSACIIIIGEFIYEYDRDTVYKKSIFFTFFVFIFSILVSVLIIVFKDCIFALYDNLSLEVLYLSGRFLIIFSLFLSFKWFNTIFFSSLIKVGGDNWYGFFVKNIILWFFTIPTLWIFVNSSKFSPVVIYIVPYFFELITFLIALNRYKSKQWITNNFIDI